MYQHLKPSQREMIKSHAITTSPSPYTQDIQLSIMRGYKYFRVVKQFNENEEISKRTLALFFNKIKKARILNVLKLQIDSHSKRNLKLDRLQLALKLNSQRLRELDIARLHYSRLKKTRISLSALKKLSTICIPNDPFHIKKLSGLRKAEAVFINMTRTEMKYNLLYKALINLVNLKNLVLLALPASLNELFSVLRQLSAQCQRPVKFQIFIKDQHNYNEPLDFDSSITKNLVKLGLQDLSSEKMLQNLFSKQPDCFGNLRSLRLGFIVPDSRFASYLTHLKEINLLEKLFLSFSECWDVEFVEGVVKCLQLPALIQDLKITMPLSFKNLIIKHAYWLEGGKKQKESYHWREHNFFEEEPLFFSFFSTIEQAKCLKKVEFDFQMIERFSSYYTNFFVSMLNRLPNISSFNIHVTDYMLQEDFLNQIPERCDLALILQACCRIKHLEHIEVLMPNLLFEDAEIDHTMSHLKSFIIGVTENEEEGVLKFRNVSKQITKWVNRLVSVAPQLTSLILDFTEVIDEVNFCKRFAAIEKIKRLEAFCSRFTISECRSETARKVGKMLQSLKMLNTTVLRFVESDRNVLEIKKYLNYQRSLREILFSFNQRNWIGKDDTTSSESEMNEEEYESLDESSLDDAVGFETDDIGI